MLMPVHDFKTLLIRHFRAMVKPYEVKPHHMGLDREDQNKLIGMERGIEAAANAFLEFDPNFDTKKFLKACGHSMMDLGYVAKPDY
jgi:hypothetical protein